MPAAAAAAPALARALLARLVVARGDLREVLPRERVLPFRELVVALAGRRDRQLEHGEGLREVALARERLWRGPPPPALAGEDGLREQDHPRPLRDPPRQPRRADHLGEH